MATKANQQTSQVAPEANIDWVAPGPGSWVRDRSHGPPNPTRFFRRIASDHTAEAYSGVMEELGSAIRTVDIKFVHGSMYRRLVPLVGAKFDRGTPPPNALLWLITRIHPEFRHRERIAAVSLAGDPFSDEVEKWRQERPILVAENLRLSLIDPEPLDRSSLADHVVVLGEHLVAGWRRHHELHASDLGPIGDLLVHTKEWGMDSVEVMDLLQGASLATAEAAYHGRKIATALQSAGVDPTSIEDVNQIRVVPEAEVALDQYLNEFGWRMVTSYDLEGRTLREIPSAICSLVLRAGQILSGTGSTDEASDFERFGPHDLIPLTEAQESKAQAMSASAGDSELFRELLDRARRAYGLRDDNGPLTWEWPVGLMRRAYLAASSALTADGDLVSPEHVFELDTHELEAVLRGDTSITQFDVIERARLRQLEAELDGPDFFGPPPSPSPDLTALPPALARVMAIVVAAATMLEPDQDREIADLSGLGIGTEPYQGRARVADDADEAIASMLPGEILVVAWTAPSFNAVLSIAGGAVVQEGGLLCHAAVMARELGIPTVVGCTNAMSLIKTGDLVEIDPKAGTAKVIAAG